MQTFTILPNNVTAFRLKRQNLTVKLPQGEMMTAVSACPVANTPPGSAAISLAARVEGIGQKAVQEALEIEKTSMQTWTLRGSPHIFSTAEASIYLVGLRPQGDVERLGFIRGIEQGLKQAGISLEECIRATESAVKDVLDSRVICSKRRLDHELAAAARKELPTTFRAAWDQPSLYGPDQSMGEALVSFCLRLAALDGWICFVTRQHEETCYGRLDQWIDNLQLSANEGDCGKALVKRYLYIYGPSNIKEFAAWAGIGQAQAGRLWVSARKDMLDVDVTGRKLWILDEDVPAFKNIPDPSGVRLLPAHDPYLQTRDHLTLAGDRRQQLLIWKTVGSPGVILVNGAITGIWRSTKSGNTLKIRIDWFQPLPKPLHQTLSAEAQVVANLKGCQDFHITDQTSG